MIRHVRDGLLTQLERIPSRWGIPLLLIVAGLVWLVAMKLFHVII